MNTPILKGRLSHQAEQLGTELAAEMRRRWCTGEQPLAEQFLSDHPELWDCPEAAIDLVYEEYCLRQKAGHADIEQDILRRFPQWAGPLRVMLDCHRRLLQSDRDEPAFPSVGDRIGEFRLLAELARGSRGRVFLATQTALADRPVVLKITPLDGAEHQSLARLQHTNIVPLHSVFDDADKSIRVLCMPYFGGATLASLLESLVNVPLNRRTGRHILDVIDCMQDPSSPQAVAGAARQMLASVSYVQALCWITACLADALQFAHERGLVHLDLKPSNVLLATDGQPMLLDFHLAREPIVSKSVPAEGFGGTPPYMPAEQRSAMLSLQNGLPVETNVDRRADVFALGAMFYEALGGQLPLKSDSPPLSRVNPQVSTGLSDIAARCLADQPEDRYTDAGALADDLRRHLTDQPLACVPNRSFAERWYKWRRRRSVASRAAGLLVLFAAVLGVLLAGIWSDMRDRKYQAELALRDGQRQLQNAEHVSEAARTFERGLGLAKSLPFQRELQRQLSDQLTTAQRLVLARQLHQLADKIRELYGADSLPNERLRPLSAQCIAFWQKRGTIMQSLAWADDADLRADLQDIAIFAASAQAKLPPGLETNRREALRLLNETEATFGPSAILDYQRRMLQPDSATRVGSPVARTAWEHSALGRALLASGDLPAAARELTASIQLDPAGRWPNFYYGVCVYRMARYDDAVAAFSVCIGSAPAVAGFYYNRALAYTALARPEQALRDYDQVLHLDPTSAAAALNRGVLQFQQSHHDQAIADLNSALAHGADPAAVHYDLALVHLAMNQPAIALQHVRQATELDPNHQAARQLQANLEHAAHGP